MGDGLYQLKNLTATPHFRELDTQRLTALLTNASIWDEHETPIVFRSNGLITLLYPIPYWSGHPYATVLVMVDSTLLSSQLMLGAIDGAAMIVDASGAPIVSVGSWEGFGAREPAASSSEKITINGADYLLSCRRASVGGFWYLSLVSESVLMSGGVSPWYTIAFITMLLLVLGRLIAHWVYAPMKSLLKSISGKSTGRVNEYEFIISNFNRLAISTHELEDKLRVLMIRRIIELLKERANVPVSEKSETQTLIEEIKTSSRTCWPRRYSSTLISTCWIGISAWRPSRMNSTCRPRHSATCSKGTSPCLIRSM
jgi:hypothetical protein